MFLNASLGYRARCITAQQLAAPVGRVLTAAGRQRVLQPFLSCDLLVRDELGYLPTEASFGPALSEVIAGRSQRRPTILTANQSLTEGGAIVPDRSLAAALLDRMLHHGQVFYLKVPSWRVKGRTPEGGAEAEASA